ncbi:recombinase family protein [Humibacillus xanthopallidus]
MSTCSREPSRRSLVKASYDRGRGHPPTDLPRLRRLGAGVKRQLAHCAKLDERLGWSVNEVYEDNDVSATRSKPRPAYVRMMQDRDLLTRTPRQLEDVVDHADRLG